MVNLASEEQLQHIPIVKDLYTNLIVSMQFVTDYI